MAKSTDSEDSLCLNLTTAIYQLCDRGKLLDLSVLQYLYV